MEFDRDEHRRRERLRKAQAKAAQLQERLQRLRHEEKAARKKLKDDETKSEIWHRMRLGYADRLAGYDGQDASARMYLRLLTLPEFVMAIASVAAEMDGAPMIDIEVAAVKANLTNWTSLGDALLLERARQAYESERARFLKWQTENPNNIDWRGKQATTSQWFLIERTAAYLQIAVPGKLNRGEAFDWLETNGANLRLRRPQNDGEVER